ncbi:hypothetical protein XNC3_3030011 [Xenorhabdus nematophila F1]|nr:hypothetical protein XNC3_3030011 [Xenorhabdus nematophila F1]
MSNHQTVNGDKVHCLTDFKFPFSETIHYVNLQKPYYCISFSLPIFK